MRKARILREGGVYHVTSRVIERKLIFDETEKERIRIWLYQLADFAGITVLTHAIMGNHFHLLVEVPSKPSCKSLDEKELARRLDYLPGKPTCKRSRGAQFLWEIDRLRRSGDLPRMHEKCEAVRSRMYDLSAFVKDFKQRISQDYNERHERKGPLWEERFHSTVVQEVPGILLKVASYIDLNPVRAGLSRDPAKYRYCGYGMNAGGDPRSMFGFKRLFELLGHENLSEQPGKALEAYRVALFVEGAYRPGKKAETRASLSDEEVNAVLKMRGKTPLGKQMKLRLHYLSTGMVLGTRIFVEGFAKQHRERNHLKREIKPGEVDEALGLIVLNMPAGST
ncbi:MAG: transposase [Verrucomicrobia bacterium]|nr:transposase [Verrucomicrobiota bacterium]MCH8510687.1 transposase [Kiritimatiellia bacterium]